MDEFLQYYLFGLVGGVIIVILFSKVLVIEHWYTKVLSTLGLGLAGYLMFAVAIVMLGVHFLMKMFNEIPTRKFIPFKCPYEDITCPYMNAKTMLMDKDCSECDSCPKGTSLC